MARLLLRIFVFCLFSRLGVASAFGVTHSGNTLVVDTGADLVFSIDDRNGDLTSMRFHGSELASPEHKASQVASGLGHAQVAVKTAGDVIVISAQAGELIHYYLAKKGRNALYMATYAPALLPVGELRFVTRLDVKKFPKADWGNDSNVGKAIEGNDVFLLPDGRTSSKFYSARPMIDDDLHGVHGPGVAVFMLTGNHELSSGGPFFKDIATQKTQMTHELYNYMYSSHTQTEPFRPGLHGIYGLLFTTGEKPSATLTDVGFIHASLGLKGFVDQTERGTLSGVVTGMSDRPAAVVGLRNASAEYWTRVDSQGRFTLTGVRQGHYQITLYDKEREVAQRTADIQAGRQAQIALAAQTLPGQVIWQTGSPDGTPSGFRNARLLMSAHPSDRRMSPWTAADYLVGTASQSDFPAAQWRDINSPTRIRFMLSRHDVHDLTLRIFITLAQSGGRPQVSVNQRWTAPIPPASDQPASRGITRGTFRGNNALFTFVLPASALQAGINTLDINVASGQKGTGFLSPGFVYDSIQLVR
ncbi:rhamnogalacturonan lyase B N-terminal domain-containing protein [Pantoea stewartii]|uniref:rhamnogalacturonan lyase B N-terminal domain-containing protein n=1 Tax=Pantoea stewartii TaxID=66269 RepID=UPI00197D95C2|nr:rhamnogalacturonan lyase B N-terminal domain-containing protein [Pantoea stewartii]